MVLVLDKETTIFYISLMIICKGMFYVSMIPTLFFIQGVRSTWYYVIQECFLIKSL